MDHWFSSIPSLIFFTAPSELSILAESFSPSPYRAARKMIVETKSYPILNGARGKTPLDQKSIRKLLLLCSEIIESYPDIEEMDLNPVIVYESGLGIVDARVILKAEASEFVNKG